MPKYTLDETHAAMVQKSLTSYWRSRLFMLTKLPMGFFADIRVAELTPEGSKVTVPYRWINKNPFKSTFWAVLGMAAELSTGTVAVLYTHKQKPSISMLVTNCTGGFVKKATGLTTFVFDQGSLIREALEQAVETGEGVEVVCPTKGYDSDGQLIAEFTFTWSFKVRRK